MQYNRIQCNNIEQNSIYNVVLQCSTRQNKRTPDDMARIEYNAIDDNTISYATIQYNKTHCNAIPYNRRRQNMIEHKTIKDNRMQDKTRQ